MPKRGFFIMWQVSDTDKSSKHNNKPSQLMDSVRKDVALQIKKDIKISKIVAISSLVKVKPHKKPVF